MHTYFAERQPTEDLTRVKRLILSGNAWAVIKETNSLDQRCSRRTLHVTYIYRRPLAIYFLYAKIMHAF